MTDPLKIMTANDIAAALSASIDGGGLLLDETQLGADFFELRTGLAGEVFRKFTNYRARLAIVIADASVHGSRFSELVYEHRTHKQVRFFASEQLARQWLNYLPVAKC
jgi:Domain of unknown function (DUF4180)